MPNVLFIIVDDLRPEFGAYGFEHVLSPNLDRLAAGSIRFDRAHCQHPICGASRASMLTGVRPLPDRFTDYFSRADQDAPGIVTLAQHLRRHGYTTLSRGKVLHDPADSPAAWSDPTWVPPHALRPYRSPEHVKGFYESFQRVGTGVINCRGPAFECYRGPDSVYPDYQTTDMAMADLRRLASGNGPFFLAVGYTATHLPFNAPQRHWDLYDRDDLPEPPDQTQPADVPAEALHQFMELRVNYSDIPRQGPLDRDLARTLRRGYWATVSYLDEQVGRLLDELDRLKLAEDTIVVFTADHGWNLGEHGLWCKHCLYDTSLRVPLMIRVPGRRPGVHEEPVESLNLYPTLCRLCDLPDPEHRLEGVSMVPVLEQPGRPLGRPTFSRYFDGESVWFEGMRYSEWRSEGLMVARTLFDHRTDPGELTNLAEDPAWAREVARRAAMVPGGGAGAEPGG